MKNKKVTLIIVPRERFSYTQKSLESIYQNTNAPFDLIYIDLNSPSKIEHYLETQSQEKNFHLIRVNRYLSPHQARNLALAHVDTEYVVFMDNDVLVKPGWLEALVKCGDETKAWVVGPLCLEGDDFAKVHMAGGTYQFKQHGSQRWMFMRRPCFRTSLSRVRTKFKRQPTKAIEFHCVLVRMEVFQELGLLDEKIINVGQEDDLCWAIDKIGKPIYFEPDSVITYVPPVTITWSEMAFFYQRWSKAWSEASLKRLRAKWNLAEDSPLVKNYKKFTLSHSYLPEPKFQKGHSYINYIIKSKTMRLVRKIINLQAKLTTR